MWVGAPLGVVFALVATVGSWPRLSAGQVLRLAALLVLGLWIASLVIGTTGYIVARAYSGGHDVWLARWLPLDLGVRAQRRADLVAVHRSVLGRLTAYYTGIAGAVLTCGVAFALRRARRREEGARSTPPAASAAGGVSR